MMYVHDKRKPAVPPVATQALSICGMAAQPTSCGGGGDGGGDPLMARRVGRPSR